MSEFSSKITMAIMGTVGLISCIYYLFIEINPRNSLYFFSSVLLFIFLFNNTQILLAKNLEEMDFFAQHRTHKNFLWGSLLTLFFTFVLANLPETREFIFSTE